VRERPLFQQILQARSIDGVLDGACQACTHVGLVTVADRFN
jgi:hypothetical protein